MATLSVTLSDAADFLDEFKAFVTGIAAPQTWVCLKDSSVDTDPLLFADAAYCTGSDFSTTLTSSHRYGPFVRRIYFRSPGLAGADNIYHCLTFLRRVATGVYAIELRNMTAFDPLLPLFDQAQVSPPVYIPITDGNNNVLKVMANGRRAIIGVKIATSSYECGYIGFGWPSGTPAEVPYPYMTGGSWHGDPVGALPTSSAVGHRAFFRADGQEVPAAYIPTAPVAGVGQSTLVVLRPNTNGQWLSVGLDQYDTWGAFVGPTLGSSEVLSGTTLTGPMGSADRLLYPCDVLALYDAQPALSGHFGELDGVYWVSGHGTLAAEDTLTIAGKTYLVWRDTNQAALINRFAAFLWE